MSGWQPGLPLPGYVDASVEESRLMFELIPDHQCCDAFCEGQSLVSARWPEPFRDHEEELEESA